MGKVFHSEATSLDVRPFLPLKISTSLLISGNTILKPKIGLFIHWLKVHSRAEDPLSSRGQICLLPSSCSFLSSPSSWGSLWENYLSIEV